MGVHWKEHEVIVECLPSRQRKKKTENTDLEIIAEWNL